MIEDRAPSDPKATVAAILHIAVILLAYSSPVWLDWRLVAVGIALYYIQIATFGGCVLSLVQFKGEKKSMHEWYLAKLGFRPDRTKLKFFLDRILPFLFLALALILQAGLALRPCVSL